MQEQKKVNLSSGGDGSDLRMQGNYFFVRKGPNKGDEWTDQATQAHQNQV